MVRKYVEASAPGRLDVMGGIADYSGSLVLQMPIAQETFIQLSLRDDYQCSLKSQISTGEILTATVDYRDFTKNDEINYQFAQEKFHQQSEVWIAYILGCALVLQKEKGIEFKGADFTIQSSVPLGKGVSSSASIEVATMKALVQAFGIPIKGTELPILAQRVENFLVGAPCGLMDQLACYLGQPNKILSIVCQPDIIEESISLPNDVSFIGIDSGVRHSVSGASYSDVRCAAFMGFSIIAKANGIDADKLAAAMRKTDFSTIPYQGYLCNIPVGEYEKLYIHEVPFSLRGNEFLEQYQISIDRVTSVDPTKIYSIRNCTSHPVYENERVNQFKKHLKSLNELESSLVRTNVLRAMGDLMFQSHESYSRCGLGSNRTDEIVNLAKDSKGIYGAKITGGGNGGTVCLLTNPEGRISARTIHQFLCDKYQQDLTYFDS